MSAHTPAPWFLARPSYAAESVRYVCAAHPSPKRADPVEIAVVYAATNGDHQDANARLIAAAPELLDALRAFCGAGARCEHVA
jgi:hypothetical protein